MVRGAYKSGSRKRVDVRTIRATKHVYREKSVGKPVSMTGKPLPGTVGGTKSQIRKVAPSRRSPNRPFGGVLNSTEMRSFYRAQARLSLE